MVSSAPRVSPGFGGPASPYHISCFVGPKLKSSIVFSRLAKRASETTVPSLTSVSACLVLSGVTRLSVPRSSSAPQRPQLESDCSIATTCSKVMRRAGSWVEGCGAIGVAAGAAVGLCSWAAAIPIGFASSDKPASATTPAVDSVILVKCVFMVSPGDTNSVTAKGESMSSRYGLELPLLAPLRLPFCPQSGAIDGLASEIDRVDLADIGNVVERIGVEHDEIGALAGRHHAELVEAQHLGGIPRRRDDHFHRGEARRDHVVELQERVQPEPAVAVSGGVAAEHLPHAGGMELPDIDGVENRPCWHALAFARLVDLGARADQRGRNGFPHQRLVEPGRRAVFANERHAVYAAEVWSNADVALLGEPDEFIIDLLVADAVQEAFDAGAHEELGVNEVEHVGDRPQALLARLIGRCGEHLRRKLLLAAVTAVDPDLDEIGLVGREILHGLARLRDAGDRIGNVVPR